METLAVERDLSGQEFIKEDAQRVDVGASVDVGLVELGLLRAHVFDRAHDLAKLGKHRFFGQMLADCFGDPEIDDFGDGTVVVVGHEDIGRLQVTVDDALLVRVLHGVADGDEQFQTLARGKAMLVGVLDDRDAFDKLHDEVRASCIGCPCINHPCDVGVVHKGQGLPFGLKTGDHLRLSMPGLMILRATIRWTGRSCRAM